MLNRLRQMLRVHSPSRLGMTQREWEECGKRMQEGFEEGWAETKERCSAFEREIEQAIEKIKSEIQSPPG